MPLNVLYMMCVNPVRQDSEAQPNQQLADLCVFVFPQSFVLVRRFRDGFLSGVSHHRAARHLQRRQCLPTGAPVRHGQRQTRG